MDNRNATLPSSQMTTILPFGTTTMETRTHIPTTPILGTTKNHATLGSSFASTISFGNTFTNPLFQSTTQCLASQGHTPLVQNINKGTIPQNKNANQGHIPSFQNTSQGPKNQPNKWRIIHK
jgi:hypothetical protein